MPLLVPVKLATVRSLIQVFGCDRSAALARWQNLRHLRIRVVLYNSVEGLNPPGWAAGVGTLYNKCAPLKAAAEMVRTPRCAILCQV